MDHPKDLKTSHFVWWDELPGFIIYFPLVDLKPSVFQKSWVWSHPGFGCVCRVSGKLRGCISQQVFKECFKKKLKRCNTTKTLQEMDAT